ncbi:hypothetical protein IM543_11245 [Massilia sp. UMI-21]|nr:hypothetical protein IM543_11245 [Massilia sp. UMI-21]
MSIRDRILARPELADLRAARDLDGLAAALNASAPLVSKQRFITARAVLTQCQDGAAILTALETAAPQNVAVAYALRFLGQDAGLDIGDPGAHALLDQLALAGILSEAHIEQLKALARKPDLVTRLDVETAMYNPDGTEK